MRFLRLFSILSFVVLLVCGVSAQSISINLDASKLNRKIEESIAVSLRGGEPRMAKISMPWFDNYQIELELEEASQFAPALQAKYPNIKSYRIATPDGMRHGRLNTSPEGVFMVLLGGDGPVGIFHENEGLLPSHKLERIDLDAESAAFGCDVDASSSSKRSTEESRMLTNSCFQFGATLRKFRMALGCTGEFAALNGGTLTTVNAAYNNRLAELNAIYEVDAAITFELIAGNDVLINFDASTDPFTNPTSSLTSLPQAETFVEGLIADADYDIGHVINATAAGSASGRAGLGVVCVNGAKARGWSTIFNNSSLRIFQHEVGHMFDCEHTNFGCTSSGAQRYEVGRGNTIMNPGTIPDCVTGANSVNSIAPISSTYFHVGSVVAIENHIANIGTCFSSVSTGNGAPTADASAASGNTIPANTPFILEGGGSDPNGTTLNYCWEQYDTDGTSTGFPSTTANSTVAPLFRSNAPTTEPDRYFPKLSTILSGVAPDGTDGELLPNVSRTMTFRLTTRDGTTGNACDETSVSVVQTGAPFQVTSQNSATSWTANGSNTATLTWDVAGTTANGINTANVDILFSDDGGATFSFAIASATPNDGTHTFVIPAFATSNGRIMVRGTGNIFLDINDAPITITVGGTCDAKAISISPATPVTAQAGDVSLDLALSPDWGNQLSSPYSMIVDNGDPTSRAYFEDANNLGSCNSLNSGNYYQEQQVYAGSNSTYTFSATGSGPTSGNFINCATLFENDYQSSCTDFLGSTRRFSGSSVFNQTFTAAMNTSTSYDLIAFATNGNATGTVNVTFSGGSLYDGIPDPGAGYFYTYGIINDATGNIVTFDPSADLSNASTFPAGTYTVFGASVETGTTLSTYEGGTKAAFVNAAALQTICARVSTNDISVTITADPLPVELVTFSGEAMANGNQLFWETASEIESDYFQIERLEGSKWSSAGTVATQGVASVYTFTDPQTASGTYYYRLAIIDNDGSTEYSSTVSVLRASKESKRLTVFPNPSSSGDFTLQWSEDKQAGLISIYDAVGRLNLQYTVSGQDAASLEIKTGLPPGTYTLEVLYANRAVETARIVVVP